MVYVHLATGFEEVEALTVVDVLRRGGVDVKTVSVMDDKTVQGAHNVKVTADLLFGEADYDACDMIVLPGGLPGAQYLKEHEGLGNRILEFAGAGKQVCAICAAPMVLGNLGLDEGRRMTIYPGMEDEIPRAKVSGELVTVDGNFITGMGPGAAMTFAFTILETLAGPETAGAVHDGMFPA